MKTLDVDKYLEDKGVMVKIKGKEYIVNDIPFRGTEDEEEIGEKGQKEMLCRIVGCPMEDLKGYGIAAVSGIIRFLTENLLPEPSRKDQ